MIKSRSAEAKIDRGAVLVSDGTAVMRDQIRRLRALAGFGAASAKAVARAVKVEARKQIAAGLGPDGRPLQLTKDGRQPLKNAGEVITVRAVGTTVIMVVKNHHARHHLGFAKGKVVRQLIPTDKLPDTMTKAITKVVTGEFEQIMGDSK